MRWLDEKGKKALAKAQADLQQRVADKLAGDGWKIDGSGYQQEAKKGKVKVVWRIDTDRNNQLYLSVLRSTGELSTDNSTKLVRGNVVDLDKVQKIFQERHEEAVRGDKYHREVRRLEKLTQEKFEAFLGTLPRFSQTSWSPVLKPFINSGEDAEKNPLRMQFKIDVSVDEAQARKLIEVAWSLGLL
jgi:hypothetical protein